jgi:hypothetical protein
MSGSTGSTESTGPADLFEDVIVPLAMLPDDAPTGDIRAILSDDLALQIMTGDPHDLPLMIAGYVVLQPQHFAEATVGRAAEFIAVTETERASTPADITGPPVEVQLLPMQATDDGGSAPAGPEEVLLLTRLLTRFTPGATIISG